MKETAAEKNGLSCVNKSLSSPPAGDIQIIPPQELGGYAGEGRLTLGASAGGVGLLLSRLSFSELVPFSDWFAGKV